MPSVPFHARVFSQEASDTALLIVSRNPHSNLSSLLKTSRDPSGRLSLHLFRPRPAPVWPQRNSYAREVWLDDAGHIRASKREVFHDILQ